MSENAVSDRTAFVGRGRRLEYFTVGWNALEGLVAVATGAIAGSIALEQWIVNWSDIVDFEVHPVIRSEEASEKIRQRL
jgi:altronate dehydratase